MMRSYNEETHIAIARDELVDIITRVSSDKDFRALIVRYVYEPGMGHDNPLFMARVSRLAGMVANDIGGRA